LIVGEAGDLNSSAAIAEELVLFDTLRHGR
jgi:hypothetical protein